MRLPSAQSEGRPSRKHKSGSLTVLTPLLTLALPSTLGRAQSPKTFEQFMPVGIDIQQYTVQLPRYLHRLRPFGLHTGPNNWNAQWRTALAKYENNPTVQQVQGILKKMLNQLEEHMSAVEQFLEEGYEEMEPVTQEVESEIPPVIP
ncbi:MAG: hypothetical protein ABSH50_12155 [Bryobacteraceae bacterium]